MEAVAFSSDIMCLFSHYLSPRYLALVCKLYDSMYDEFWYYQYLLTKYTEADIIGRDFTYKNMCKRSLLEGEIYIYMQYTQKNLDIKLPISGIKSMMATSSERFILKFNGDLYKCDDDSKLIVFVDFNVIDINYKCYIKKSELHFYNSDIDRYESISFPIISDIQYLNVAESCNYLFYTKDTIYYKVEDEIHKFFITDGICKTYTMGLITYILTNKNTLLIYNNTFDTQPKIINNVTDLGINYVCIDKKYYYFNPQNIEFYFDFDDLIELDNLITCSVHRCISPDVLLIDNKIVWIDHDGKIIDNYKLECQVKRVMGGKYGVSVIKI